MLKYLKKWQDLCGIISDTLLLKSPTTTELDKNAVKALNKICKLKIEKYGLEMFKAGTSLDGMSIQDILELDSKTFKNNDVSFTVSQAFTLDIDGILKDKESYIEKIEEYKSVTNVNAYLFVVTDIIKNGSYIFYNKDSEESIKKSFNLKKISEGIFVKDIVSRKKQIVPVLIDTL